MSLVMSLFEDEEPGCVIKKADWFGGGGSAGSKSKVGLQGKRGVVLVEEARGMWAELMDAMHRWAIFRSV